MNLLTWNTQWFCGLDGKVDVDRVIRHAQALIDFDVLCLQEVAVGYPGLQGDAGAEQPAQVAALLGRDFKVFFGASVDGFSAISGAQQRFGNLIATRLPVMAVEHHRLPWPADASVRSMPRLCTVVTVMSPLLGAVRIMTTHLEFYSKVQRLAQASALRAIHIEACTQAAAPPETSVDGSPFQSRVHTPHAILCGDFNLERSDPEYERIQASFNPLALSSQALLAINSEENRLMDVWPILHPESPQPPTFRLFDRRYGPEPGCCDFVFASDDLASRVQDMQIDGATQASDHQPVMVRFS